MERKVVGRSQDIQERYPICPMHYYEIRTHLDDFLNQMNPKIYLTLVYTASDAG